MGTLENTESAILMLLIALGIDFLFGEFPSLLHPVVWIGKTISWLETLLPREGRALPFFVGMAGTLLVCAFWTGAAWAVLTGLTAYPVLKIIFGGVLLKSTFALQALGDAAKKMHAALTAADLNTARATLSSLCSRDPATLSAAELSAATIESVAENLSDSFVAPLLFFAIFGLPGAVFYRTVNTLDAMIGYHGRHEYSGKFAARLDDVCNWLPARLTAGLLLFAAWLQGHDVRSGAKVMWRDGDKTESPNAGRPMAVVAGALGVELAKPGAYRLGAGKTAQATEKIAAAWQLVFGAAMLWSATLLILGVLLRASGFTQK